ncbi:putative inorganic carbon transporter subunit DabA [Methylicorpusculum oleiharenae]|uniref:putative inorganic carbon transporter subunit DabA n=1 Tax=Methylicorpusculum oleiharenae TaxID=1338687 RepID=UPI0022AB08B8|nr:putative inorganic carbon transporter subunit DabA [Methylicorpusculum oleiharenae]
MMAKALKRNAPERCRWFELGPKTPDNQMAHEHVIARASSIFEPRPELNHFNNLYCIVGRRSLTRDLFLDRRALLHSSDPNTDVQGDILVKIMSASIPVCGSINLEYLISRLDNSVYGAGTKLSHNVIGLLGVTNDVVDDLRALVNHRK